MENFKAAAILVIVMSSVVLFSFIATAHEGHHKGAHTQAQKKFGEPAAQASAFDEIQKSYQGNVKPIFNKKCADCHSSDVHAPWYQSIPLIGRLVKSDRDEAKEHLEISKGFPFAGHGTPLEDLESIKDSVEKGTMPTKFYRLMHPASKLSKNEKSIILNWTQHSTELLNAHKTEKN